MISSIQAGSQLQSGSYENLPMIHVLLMSVYKNEENKDFQKELYHKIAQIFGSESITPMALVRLYMRNKRPIAKKQLDVLGNKLIII